MEKLFMHVLDMSISASYLILAVLAVRFLLRKAPKSMRCFLWLLVGIRLLFPFSVESVFSLVPDTSVVNEQIRTWQQEDPFDIAVTVPPTGPEPYDVTTALAGDSADKAWNIRTVCAGLWAVGVAAMLGYFAISWIRLRLRVRTAVPMDIAIDKDHRTRIYRSERIDSPFLFGIAAPRIYIPVNIADENLPYVILHEKAHIRHGDYLIKPAGFLILAVYWFNPLIWAAYALLCKDIELVCDERVIHKLGEQSKRAYSQALLDSTASRRMVTACPVAFGEVGVRERVKNVLNYKKPAFWIFIAAVLACIVVPVCFMTQKKEAVATARQLAGEYDMAVSEPYASVPHLSLGADGSFSLTYSVLSSYWPYAEHYEFDGNLLTATTDDGLYHYQFTVTDSGSLIFDAKNSSDINWVWDDRLEAPLVDGAEFVKRGADAQKAQEADIQEAAMKQALEEEQTALAKLEKEQAALEAKQAALEEEQAALLYRKVMEEEKGQKNAEDMYACIEQWAQAFCSRDAGTILRLADDKVEEKLENADLLVHGFADGKDYAGFGWSSPWPWGHDYRIVDVTDNSAEILYYAWVSDPHVTVWRELLTFDTKNDTFVITSETLEYMNNICTAEQFYQAYPGGVISATMMDYYKYNGAGEALNSHAKEGRVDAALFEADKAATYLLNLSGSTRTGITEDANVRVIQIMFGDGSSVEVTMIRPYGEDGIWLPWSGRDIELDGIQTAGMTYTAENADDLMESGAARLEALFPNPHEFMESATFPQYADLDGDGEMERIEMSDLRYNGGDGGYALKVTTKTGEEIPLPAGYTEENGFPLSTVYTPPLDGEDAWISIQWGKENHDTTIAAISQHAIIRIYEKKGLYQEFKRSYNPQEPLRIDAPSGCSIITYKGEKNPVLALKSYVSGYLGHADTLGYVITELRLQEDHTWSTYSYFLLDGGGQEEDETKTGQVTAQTLKVRSKAYTDADVVGLLENGQNVTVLSEENGFYYIQVPLKDNPEAILEGYVKKEYIRIR